MDQLLERLKKLGEKAKGLEGKLETEEATKNALVMPFIAALGYDVFDPSEVVPEFTCDVGTKRGEKVDYAIKHGDKIAILIEAKKVGASLSIENASQLYRYFSVTTARIAILTNGIRFRFFSDLVEPNKMDSVPFVEIDLAELREGPVGELKKLTKESFDLDTMLSAAGGLKHLAEIIRIMEQQFEAPEEELVRFFFARANPTGRYSGQAKEQFAGLVKNALSQVVSERVSSRLRSALAGEVSPRETPPEPATAPAAAAEGDGVVTTEEELQAFAVVRAIVCGLVPVARVFARDTKSYFGVLLDDSNRKPICRLHFNRTQRYIGLFDEQKNETKIAIGSVEDIYKFADPLRAAVARYVAIVETESPHPPS